MSDWDRSALCFPWWGENGVNEPAAKYEVAFRPFSDATFPICADYALQEVAVIIGEPNK